MDMAFARFDRILARPLGVIPDFAVLVAGLSARQSTSATARLQTTMDMASTALRSPAGPMIALFADGRKSEGIGLSGSFSPAAAQLLTPRSRT